ncbi:MAG TPA: tRNA (guanosine(46)-N7)-methyltransferase TrmB [Gammaproteobacteria bacterium]|nr:tRNA (guanosine(46)-N7)-methyltransferase TrmB [Gammaproteobacteria bacterium]
MTAIHLRKVRSFVRRPGRITDAQRRALDVLGPRFGVPDATEHLDLVTVFGRDAPRVLDIGFGDGEALVTCAANNAGTDYFGVEVHEPGIGHLLLLLEKAQLTNVRVIGRDAADVLPQRLPDGTFDAVNLFFPDPWPKKRHHKRRLVQPAFVAEVARVLRTGGLLHVATDWANYADHTRDVLARDARFLPVDAGDLCQNPLAFRPPTKFERRGRRLGHDVVDLFYRKLDAPSGPHASVNDPA